MSGKSMQNLTTDMQGDEMIDIGQHLNDIVDFMNRDVEAGGAIERTDELPNRDVELTLLERQYLVAVENGDIATLRKMLDQHAISNNFNVNCVDPLGRNALLIAIENEHVEVLDSLLSVPKLELGDSLLFAINEENTSAVELLLQAQSDKQNKKNLNFLLGGVPSSSFTPDITPIILAAHRDNYEILKILLKRGDRVDKPHDLRCTCQDCIMSRKKDSLCHSKSRINAYRALASSSLISLTSRDPILTAFELSWELKRLGRLENEFKLDYEALSHNCQTFATALLNQTRGSKELAVILNHDVGQSSTASTMGSMRTEMDDDDMEKMTLSRLKLAIKYKQKQFVAHPHCQQLLASLWYEGMPGFRRMPFFQKISIIGLTFILFPLMSAAYIVAPKSQLGKIIRRPFTKFLCHTASYITFIGLLIINALRLQFIINGTIVARLNQRAPTPSYAEWLIIVYVIAFIWAEIKQLWSEGIKTYLADQWNLFDLTNIAMYVGTITFRVIAYIRIYYIQEELAVVPRSEWDSVDPILISESIFSIATIFSTIKLVTLFIVSPKLGPLQICIGRILNDILKFLAMYCLVLIAFAFGLNQLYYFYSMERGINCDGVTYKLMAPGPDVDKYNYCITRGTYFTNFFEIIQTLYWAAYGMIDLTSMTLEYPHYFTEFIGKFLMGTYSAIAIIVLINMLIAMMNHSYQIISEQADEEWKFSRSILWVSYFENAATLPPPFNLLPSPKSIYYMGIWIYYKLFSCGEAGKKNKLQSIRKLIRKVNEIETRYQSVMRDLIKRYLMYRQRQEDKTGVTEDDLTEIKGDISAFRFELLDILKKNGMEVTDPQKVQSTGHNRMRNRPGSKRSLNRLSRQFDIASITEEANEDGGNDSTNTTENNTRANGVTGDGGKKVAWRYSDKRDDSIPSIKEDTSGQLSNQQSFEKEERPRAEGSSNQDLNELALDPKKLPFDNAQFPITQMNSNWQQTGANSPPEIPEVNTYTYDGALPRPDSEPRNPEGHEEQQDRMNGDGGTRYRSHKTDLV